MFACVHSGETKGGRVHSGSRGFTMAHLRVFGFILGSHVFTPGRLAVVGFILVRVGSLGHADGG